MRQKKSKTTKEKMNISKPMKTKKSGMTYTTFIITVMTNIRNNKEIYTSKYMFVSISYHVT